MKTIILLFLLATLTARAQVKLLWSFNTNGYSPDLVFKVYETPSLAPGSPFNLLTNVSATNFVPFTGTNYQGTNFIATNGSLVLNIQPGQHYFYLSTSNFWGESQLSSPAYTPPIAPFVSNTLQIQRAP